MAVFQDNSYHGKPPYVLAHYPFPGTQLATEFADFLKDDGGRGTILAGFYRKMSTPPRQGV